MSILTVGCVLAGCHTQPKASVLIQPSDSVAGNRLTAPGGSADNSQHRSLIHTPKDRAEHVTETRAPKPAASGQKAEDFSASPHQSDSDQRRTSSSSLWLATLDIAVRPSASRPRSRTTVGGLYWLAQLRPPDQRGPGTTFGPMHRAGNFPLPQCVDVRRSITHVC